MKFVLAISIVVTCFIALALRDPFVRGAEKHRYEYLAFGMVHGTQRRFGVFLIDAVSYQIKEGDTIVDHQIVSLSETQLILNDPQKHEIKIPLQKKALQLR